MQALLDTKAKKDLLKSEYRGIKDIDKEYLPLMQKAAKDMEDAKYQINPYASISAGTASATG